MAGESTKTETAAVTAQPEQHVQEGVDDGMDFQPSSSKIVRFYSHPWTQIVLISVICFCLPGVSSPQWIVLDVQGDQLTEPS